MNAPRIRPAGRLRERWQLRIELLDVNPLVWRRLLLPADIALPKLHRVFQIALGWTDSHLHEFVIGGVRYAHADPEWAAELKQTKEHGVALTQALGPDARGFDYLYDFGDDWHHLVVVEERLAEPAKTGPTIICMDGENACPPEDVGGPPGYADFLDAIADPQHEEHRNCLEWCDGAFDPARFDRAAVNRALGKLRA
ncbi:MAG: plasmid pRiA4b ORF-3 family protein [Steroidobacteraceae bacterium]